MGRAFLTRLSIFDGFSNELVSKIETKFTWWGFLTGFSSIILISICIWSDNVGLKARSGLLDVDVRHACIDGNCLALSLLCTDVWKYEEIFTLFFWGFILLQSISSRFQSVVHRLVWNIPNYISKIWILRGNLQSHLQKLLTKVPKYLIYSVLKR